VGSFDEKQIPDRCEYSTTGLRFTISHFNLGEYVEDQAEKDPASTCKLVRIRYSTDDSQDEDETQSCDVCHEDKHANSINVPQVFKMQVACPDAWKLVRYA